MTPPRPLALVDSPTPTQVAALDRELAGSDRGRFGLAGDPASHHHLAVLADDRVVGLATVSAGAGAQGRDQATLATSPAATDDTRAQAATMVVASVQDFGPSEREWWLSGASQPEQDAVTTAGFTEDRMLYQLRVSLPLAPGFGPANDVSLRSFNPGVDKEAFLEVNRRAFVWHPEQGDMTRADLNQAMTEPWFNADGFLIHPADGPIDGFCWTKIHPDTHPALGEIYVIAVHPDAGGRGLGTTLVTAGLAWLHDQGLRTGMLYVEGDNDGAVGLYRKLGFVEHHRDQRFISQP